MSHGVIIWVTANTSALIDGNGMKTIIIDEKHAQSVHGTVMLLFHNLLLRVQGEKKRLAVAGWINSVQRGKKRLALACWINSVSLMKYKRIKTDGFAE